MRWRTELLEQGWDGGAASIFNRMQRAGQDPPSIRTVYRVLVRRGMVTAQPAKRPRSSYRRFEYPRTNDCWQVDATETRLADGSRRWCSTSSTTAPASRWAASPR